MTGRELRLRRRIDQLIDEREVLAITARVAEEENERLLERCSYYRNRVYDLERSRAMWRDRFRATTHETLKAIDRRRKRRKVAA